MKIFKLGPEVQEMSFKNIFIWSSAGPFVQQSRTICAIMVEGIKKNNSVNLFLILGQWFRRCHLKCFLSGALAALMFSGAEPFMQF